MRRSLSNAEEAAHAEAFHLVGLEHLDRAAIGLEAARDLGHALRREVVRRSVREVTPEGETLADLGALVERGLVGTEHEDLVDRPLHRVGVADAAVDVGGPIRPGHGTGSRGAPRVAILTVAKPEGERPRPAAVQPSRGDLRQPARAPGAAAPTAGVEEEQAAGGERRSIDERAGVLEHVELAPGDGIGDCAIGGGVELGKVAADVRVLAVDRHGEDIGLDGGRRAGNSAQAHSVWLLREDRNGRRV